MDAVIGPQKSAQVDFLMDLGDKARVPIISFSATSPSLVHKTPYFVQTAQSDANQVQAIASIIKAFLWTQVVVIYEDTEFGNGIILYLSNALQDVNAQVPHRSVLPISATNELISNELYKVMTMQTRVFVMHTSQILGTRLFLKARELGSQGYVWIVTSVMTDIFSSISPDGAGAMQGGRGVFGLWAYDTLWALGMAAEIVGVSQSSAAENENSVDFTSPFTSGVSGTGHKLLKVLLATRLRGLSRRI